MFTQTISRLKWPHMLSAGLVVLLTACGGGGGSADNAAQAQNDEALLKRYKVVPPSSTTTTPTTTTTTTTTPTSTTTPTTTTPTSTTTTTTSPTTTSTAPVVPAEFFGMHLAAQGADGWPSVKFAIQRTWDAWPGVAWSDLNPSQGNFSWANLDALVNDSLSHGVELVYTFGYAPQWASTNPGGTCSDSGGASGPNGSCYAPQMQAWTDFVTQITTRYKGKIKYWELWNEPNAGNFWQGSNAQMVEMAKQAYPIIKNSGGVVLTPAPQGMNANVWMDGYLGAGGSAYADVVTFHGYVYGPPENLNTLADNMRSVQSKYNLGALPLWDTEHSWGDKTWPMGADQDQQSAWLARYLALSFSKGIQRSIWYGWEFFNWGSLYDRTTKQILKPGIAYREVYNWMIGANFSPCQASGSLYQCKLTRANGYQALMVWSTGSAVNFAVPSGYSQMKTIDAQTSAVSAGQTLSIGMKPVLIANQ